MVLISQLKLKLTEVLKVKQICMVINLWENGILWISSKRLQVLLLQILTQEVTIVDQHNLHGEIILCSMCSVKII
jgi:hypothetical protein